MITIYCVPKRYISVAVPSIVTADMNEAKIESDTGNTDSDLVWKKSMNTFNVHLFHMSFPSTFALTRRSLHSIANEVSQTNWTGGEI